MSILIQIILALLPTILKLIVELIKALLRLEQCEDATTAKQSGQLIKVAMGLDDLGAQAEEAKAIGARVAKKFRIYH